MKRVAVVLGAALLLSACGSGGGGGTTVAKSPQAQIKAAYLGFFSADGTLHDHQLLLEDGTDARSPVQVVHFIGQPGSISATVSKVTLQGASKAKVIFSTHYSIYNLNDRTGYAVLQDGKWKVASGTVCELVAIWNGIPWPPCNS